MKAGALSMLSTPCHRACTSALASSAASSIQDTQEQAQERQRAHLDRQITPWKLPPQWTCRGLKIKHRGPCTLIKARNGRRVQREMRKGQGKEVRNQASAMTTGIRTQYLGPAVRWKTMEEGSLEIDTALRRLQEKGMEGIPHSR